MADYEELVEAFAPHQAPAVQKLAMAVDHTAVALLYHMRDCRSCFADPVWGNRNYNTAR